MARLKIPDIDGGADHYPIRRRGQKRRLVPNQAGIDWLEQQSQTDTEISDEHVHGATGEWAGLMTTRALGWYSARQREHYPRRMFDIFTLETSSTVPVDHPDPCPDCYDFSRTWACTEHPEVDWSTQYRCWVRPGTSAWYQLHPEDTPPTAYYTPERRPDGQPFGAPPGLYDQLIQTFAQPLPPLTGSAPRGVVDVGHRSNFFTLGAPALQAPIDPPSFTLEITGDTSTDPVRIEVQRNDGQPTA